MGLYHVYPPTVLYKHRNKISCLIYVILMCAKSLPINNVLYSMEFSKKKLSNTLIKVLMFFYQSLYYYCDSCFDQFVLS